MYLRVYASVYGCGRLKEETNRARAIMGERYYSDYPHLSLNNFGGEEALGGDNNKNNKNNKKQQKQQKQQKTTKNNKKQIILRRHPQTHTHTHTHKQTHTNKQTHRQAYLVNASSNASGSTFSCWGSNGSSSGSSAFCSSENSPKKVIGGGGGGRWGIVITIPKPGILAPL